MKKSKLLLSSLTLLAATLAGCGEKTSSETPASSEPAVSSSEEVKTNGYFGFGNVATYEVTLPTDAKKGSVTTELNYAAILFDKDEKILDLRIDTVQIKVSVDDENNMILTGKNAADGDTPSKWELLGAYGMTNASPIKKEWYEQAEAFENFAVGKTVSELLALQGTDHNLIDGANAGVTIHVNGFMDAIERAEANKVAIDDVTDLVIGVGGIGGVQPNQTNYTIAGAAFDKDEKVVAARMDVYQVPYTIVDAADGKLAGIRVNDAANKKQVVAIDEKTGSIKSKHDLKEDYGMAGSATQGEWYVQANKITAYMVGKTLEEAYVLEGGKFVDTTVGATIKATDYLNAFLEAEHTAFNARYTA